MTDALATRLCSLFFAPGGEAASVAWTELVFARWGAAVVHGQAATPTPFVVHRQDSDATEITAHGFTLELQPSRVPFVPCSEHFPLRGCTVVVRDVRLCVRLGSDITLCIHVAHARWAMPHGNVGDLRITLAECSATLVRPSTAQQLLTLTVDRDRGAEDENHVLLSFSRGSVVLALDTVVATPESRDILPALLRARLPCKPRSDRLAPVMDNFSWLLASAPAEASASSASALESEVGSDSVDSDNSDNNDSGNECDSDDSMESAVDMSGAFELPDVNVFARHFVWRGATTLECHNCRVALSFTEDQDEELFALPHVSCVAERFWLRQQGRDLVSTVVPDEWRGVQEHPAGTGAGVAVETSWAEQSVLVSVELLDTPLVCAAAALPVLCTLARTALTPADEGDTMVQMKLAVPWALVLVPAEVPLAVTAEDVTGEGQAGTVLLHIPRATVGTGTAAVNDGALATQHTEVEYTWKTTPEAGGDGESFQRSGVRAYDDFVTLPHIAQHMPSLHGARIVVPGEPDKQRPLSREDLARCIAAGTARAQQRVRTSVRRVEGTLSVPFVRVLEDAVAHVLEVLPRDMLCVHSVDEGVLDVTPVFGGGDSTRAVLTFVDAVAVALCESGERAVSCRRFRVALQDAANPAQTCFVLADSLPTSTSSNVLSLCVTREAPHTPWSLSVGCVVLHWHETHAALFARLIPLLGDLSCLTLESVSVQVTFTQMAPVFVVVVDAGRVTPSDAQVRRLVLSGVHVHLVDGTHHLIPNDVRQFAGTSSFWSACNAVEAVTADYVECTVAHTDASTLVDVSHLNGVHLHLCCDTAALLASVLVRLWARTDQDPRPSSPDQVNWTIPDTIQNESSPPEQEQEEQEDEEERDEATTTTTTTTTSERQSLLNSSMSGGLMFRLDGTSSQLFADESSVPAPVAAADAPAAASGTVKWHTEEREIAALDEYAPGQEDDVLAALRALESVRFRLSVARADAVTVHMYDGYDWFILDGACSDAAPRAAQTAFWLCHDDATDAGGGTAVCAAHSQDTCAECVLRGVRVCAVREAALSVARAAVRAETLLVRCSVKDHIRAVPVLELDRESGAWFVVPHAGASAGATALQAVYEGCWLERRCALWVQPLHVMTDSYVSNFVDGYFAAADRLFRACLTTQECMRHAVPFGAAVVAPVTVRLTFHPDLTSGSVTHSLANGVASLISTENSVLALPRVVLARRHDCATLGRVLAAVFREWARLSYFAIAQSVVATSTHPVFSIVRIARDTAGLLAAPAQHALGAAPTVRGVPESLGQTVSARGSALVATLVHEAQSLGRGMWTAAASLYHNIREARRSSPSPSTPGDGDGSTVDPLRNTVMSSTPGAYEPWTFRHLFSACPAAEAEAEAATAAAAAAEAE